METLKNLAALAVTLAVLWAIPFVIGLGMALLLAVGAIFLLALLFSVIRAILFGDRQ